MGAILFMNIILNRHDNCIEILIFLIVMAWLALVSSRVYNKFMFRKLKKEYENEFKYSSMPIYRYENASIICSTTYLGNVIPIFKVLIMPYGKNNKSGMSENEVNFLKNLPTKIIIGFKIEALSCLVATTSLLILIPLLFITNKI